MTVILYGDSDGDGDVDLSDFDAFAECMSGPGFMPAPPPAVTVDECLEAFDYPADGDVDLWDGAKFQAAFTGPNP